MSIIYRIYGLICITNQISCKFNFFFFSYAQFNYSKILNFYKIIIEEHYMTELNYIIFFFEI